MYVVMATTTLMLLCTTPAYPRTHTHTHSNVHTHTQLLADSQTHASVSRSVSSHGSHRFTLIIPGSSFFSTLHHDNCLNSFPLSPTSVLSERCYHGNWLQLMSLKRHDWHTQLASARTHRGACTHTHTHTHTHTYTHFAHSLLCKALWEVPYYYGCIDMHRRTGGRTVH